ncbi:MAG: diiron oxygenase [Acidimicrobiales bacterium]
MAATLTSTPVVVERAARLVAAAERQSFDPFTEVDWTVPVDGPDAYYLPPEFLPLHGTDVWEAMSEQERRDYSRHECASLCSAGIWFENILMQLLMKHLYDLPATDGSHRFLLTEVADECRHSSMFGEFVRRAGTPAYPVFLPIRLGGRFMVATSTRAAAYISILTAEEILDVSNRATMKDERVHPTSRRMAKIHVAEESRHMSFARVWLEESWPRMNVVERSIAMVQAPFFAWGISQALVNPAVYRTLGIASGARIASRNPEHRARVQRDLGRLTSFLSGIGAINPVTRPVWRVLGLVGRS